MPSRVGTDMTHAAPLALGSARRVLLVIASGAIGVIFLAAAVGKAWAPMRFEMVVAHVLSGLGGRGLPVVPLVLALVGLESFIGACYLLGLAGPAVHRATLLVLAGFVVILIWMWIYPPAQGCGCIGFWMRQSDPRHELAQGLLRNLGLMACIGAAWKAPACPPYQRLRATRRPSGFSLIETLVVISVLALILALTLPAISRTRRASRRTVELSDARQVYLALTAYSADYREFFPFCGTPGDIEGPLTIGSSRLQFSLAFFTGQSKLFVNLLTPTYLATTRNISADDPEEPSAQRPLGIVSSGVWLSYTAFAHPAFWHGEAQPREPAALLRGGRWSQVQFPTSKGVLLDLRAHNREAGGAEPRQPSRPWGIVWADGSTTRRSVALERRYRTVVRPSAMFDWPVLATEAGLAGRDFDEASAKAVGIK